MKRILFISHDASRTGAPIVLLHLLNWLDDNSDLEFDVLLGKGGPLEDDFKEVSDRCYTLDRRESLVKRGWKRVKRKLKVLNRLDLLIHRLKNNDYQLIYANTCATSSTVIRLKEALKVPVVMHVHELEHTIHRCAGGAFDDVIPYIDRFIAVSGIVRNNLMNAHGVLGSHISVVPAFIPSNFSSSVKYGGEFTRKQLGIPFDAFVVGGCGTIDWVKGTDLFVLIAKDVLGRVSQNPIHFVWLGGDENSNAFLEMKTDLKKLGITSNVHLVSTRANSVDYFDAFDVFLMTSREDSFPLVCLENASLGNPIICFDNATGSTEYVDERCGHISPYLDIHDMAKAVIEFHNDSGLCHTSGNELCDRVRCYTVDNCGRLILKEIESRLMKDLIRS